MWPGVSSDRWVTWYWLTLFLTDFNQSECQSVVRAWALFKCETGKGSGSLLWLLREPVVHRAMLNVSNKATPRLIRVYSHKTVGVGTVSLCMHSYLFTLWAVGSTVVRGFPPTREKHLCMSPLALSQTYHKEEEEACLCVGTRYIVTTTIFLLLAN